MTDSLPNGDTLTNGHAKDTDETLSLTEEAPQSAEDENSDGELREQLCTLLLRQVQSFQETLITNRRQSQYRLQQRLWDHQSCYLRQFLNIEMTVLELLNEDSMEATTSSESEQNDEEDIEMAQRNDLIEGFYECNPSDFSEEQWFNAFRISKKSFAWLCQQLRQDLCKKNAKPTLEDLIPFKKRLALVIYAFATGDSHGELSKRFGVSRIFISHFIKRVAKAIEERLSPNLIRMPRREQDYRNIRNAFQRSTNMPPLVVGIMGCASMPLQQRLCPGPTVMLQALFDDKLLFRKIQLNENKPPLFTKVPNAITQLKRQIINETAQPCFVVAPHADYPLRPWLLQKYKEPMEPHEYDFNEAIENLEVFKEQGWRRLFTRWQILQTNLEGVDETTLKSIVIACCTLHNLVEQNKEVFTPAWNDSFVLVETNMEASANSDSIDNTKYVDEAKEMRDFLARTISSTEM